MSLLPGAGMRLTVLLAMALVFASGWTASVRAQDGPRVVYEEKTSLEQTNAPLLVDLFGDATPEIVLSDRAGRLEIRDSRTGKVLGRRRVAEAAVSAPTSGDFVGEGRSHLAVGTKDGRMLFLDGGTLETLAEGQVSRDGITVQPTTIRLTVNGVAQPRDAVVVIDERGSVHACHVDVDFTVKTLWSVSCQAGQYPAAYGPVRDREAYDIVVAAGNLLETFDAETGTRRMTSSIGWTLRATPCLVDVSGNSLTEVVYTGDYVGARRFDPTRGELTPLWEDQPRGVTLPAAALFGPVAAVLPDGDPSILLIQAAGSQLTPINPFTGRIATWSEAPMMAGRVATPLTLVPRRDAPPLVVYGDERNNLWFLSTTTGSGVLTPPSVAFDRAFQPVSVVAASLDADGTPSVWVIGRKKQEHLIRFDLATPAARTQGATTPWPTFAGNVWHSGTVLESEDFLAWHEARTERLRASVARHAAGYDGARARGDRDEALAHARWLMRFDPTSDEYARAHRSAWMNKHREKLILSALAFLFLSGVSLWVLIRFSIRHYYVKKAETAVTAGRLDEARTHYEAVLRRHPRDRSLNLALASVYVSLNETGQETLAVFRRAREAAPEDSNLADAQARAMALVPKTDDQALEIYRQALPAASDPALMEYAIGCCHKARGEWSEAAKHLRAALRAGRETDEVYSALCDSYLELEYRQAKAVAVYKQQYPKRRDDRRFLELFLSASADAKLVDADTEQLCRQVLALDPAHVQAYCQLAHIRMQSHDRDGAAQAIDKALEIQPDHAEALLLRSQIHMIEGRTDEAAIRIYLSTLRFYPTDRDILRILSTLFAEQKRHDDEAVAIYKRAIKENPNDVATLRALAATGCRNDDAGLVVDSIERLAALGQMNPELNNQLAVAYVKIQCADPKAERVLREALRQDPESQDFLQLLARVLLGEERLDAEAAALYERALAVGDDLAIGRQLVRAHHRNGRYGEALQLAQKLLALAPGDEELQRLVALSSLYGNKIDEAIRDYKQILQRSPDDPEATVNLALAYAQKGMTDDKAARIYQQALDIVPDNENLHLVMARVHAARGDLVRCVEAYQNTLKSKPQVEEKVLRHCEALLTEYPQALRVRWFFCEILVAYNRLREALDQLAVIHESAPAQARNVLVAIDKILNKDERNALALLKRGEILLGLDRAADARASLERAFTLQPATPEVQTALIRCYETCLAQQDDAEVRFRLGKLHFLTQDHDKAIGCFQRTAQDYRYEADSAKMLGKCFVGKGMLDLALQEFKKLVVDEETKELLYDLGQRYESKRDLIGAKTVYRQLFAADIDYKDVRQRFEMLSGSTSDPVAFEKTSIVQEMSEDAKRRYELLDELGRGAMGIVYRARDKELEEVVALKILPDNLSNNPEAVRRFKVEARNARRLSHPNIVRIHDIGEEMGRKYISMEIVEGTDLKKRVRTKGKLTLPESIDFAIQVADALAYAHRLGIVHRDVKPANIMITKKGEVKVTDFGIAKLVDSTGEGTLIGAVIGTPLYMSPEQVQGVPVDNRADIYSFGIMLYEFVNGRPPFTEGDLAYQHMHREPEPPKGCPPALWEILAKCLAKDKEQRWPTADSIVEQLKVFRKTLG